MRDVNEPDIRSHAQHDALHGSDIAILQTEIRGKGDDSGGYGHADIVLNGYKIATNTLCARAFPSTFMPSKKQMTGYRGEQYAATFLERKGYVILERNYRFMRSEVDLVAFLPTEEYDRGGDLVFVEVKWRRRSGSGSPEAAVNAAKRRNLTEAAEAYLHERKMEGTPCRFDVIALRGEPPNLDIQHYENAFMAM